MELSQDMIIDLALNAAGYLIAALLGITLYGIFTHKRKQPEPVVESASPETKITVTDPLLNELTSNEPSRRMEFIKFGGTAAEPVPPPSRPVKTTGPELRNSRPTKAEIIKLARKMLKAGAPVENIKRVLPLSDAELALLQLNNNS